MTIWDEIAIPTKPSSSPEEQFPPLGNQREQIALRGALVAEELEIKVSLWRTVTIRESRERYMARIAGVFFRGLTFTEMCTLLDLLRLHARLSTPAGGEN